ncbi:glycoside hydrolase family 3 C-terminal domain-containing protein [Demequina muriae]|uniref:Glycoside hydrolase family 3 C-terminal domain-containing protein n=1 Tax=Demequina muriae TaxID=3051664 RepID=A0ABT8GG96_9MICO|nr:glycoside hydrolase family 3 C-terminal domain-containing protein [Demequina sp. EGI L300058]MDN4480463.1 glycoside hydrolase family 3 C-terminal domain-containing protein [Demequina sp. EGI L300058]
MTTTPRKSSALTLEQKASLLTGATFWSTAAIPEHDIEAVTMSDGPHGVRRQLHGTDHLGLHHSEPATCFPPAVAVGSSWSRDVAARVGEALAKEARALGVDILLGPGVNIKRSPLGGRNFEYYSEDPLLTGELAVSYIRALQDGGVGASVKHFAANDQETERMVISSEVDDRTLREIHLSAFERVVKDAAPATVMCSYNKINGTHSAENRWLLTDVLRTEWGFAGAVVSDWGAVRTRPAAVSAGLDLAMPGPGQYLTQSVIDAVKVGTVDITAVDESVERILALSAFGGGASGQVDHDAHHDLARELAAECAVLLKNDGDTLPLAPDTSVLVVGEFATAPRFQGGGSSYVNATRVDVPLDHIRDHGAQRNVTVRALTSSGQTNANPSDLRSAAVEAARTVDVAILFAGNPESEESEGFDRERLELPSEQIELIRAVAEAAPRTIVVLANGGVVSMEEWHDDVDAILEGFLLGQGGGHALADLLFGVANPSGHLAETIPRRLKDTPTYLSFPGEQGRVRYTEGVMVGYRYYETVDAPVRYPFGHGLSYTTFEASDLTVKATGADTVAVSFDVTNTGSRAGHYVAQAYLSTDAGPVRRAERALAGFDKVYLESHETRRIELVLDRRVLAYWDTPLSRWVVAPGRYAVQVAENASTPVLEGAVDLDGDNLAPVLSLQSSVAEWVAHPLSGPALRERLEPLMAQSGQNIDDGSANTAAMLEMPMNQILSILGGAIDGDWLLSLLSQGDSEGQPALQAGTHS